MFKVVVGALCLAFPVAPSSKVTELSTLASSITDDLPRSAVIGLLGRATWVVLPSDQGDHKISNPAVGYVLYWSNSSCAPVVVSFSAGGRVLGVDEGRGVCGPDVELLQLVPPDAYSCADPERLRFCS